MAAIEYSGARSSFVNKFIDGLFPSQQTLRTVKEEAGRRQFNEALARLRGETPVFQRPTKNGKGK